MATAKQSSAPKHAGIHLHERPDSLGGRQGISRILPCTKVGEGNWASRERQGKMWQIFIKFWVFSHCLQVGGADS